MFTRNWYKALAAHFAGVGSSVKQCINVNGNMSQCASNTNGVSIKLLGTGNSPSLEKACTSLISGGYGVAFGTGTTPPTVDDIKLSGDFITGLSCSAATSYDWQDGYVDFIGIYTLTNTTAADITIGEVALMCSTSQYDYPVMFERTVLDTPVTIPAGGIGVIDYSIKLPIPTA